MASKQQTSTTKGFFDWWQRHQHRLWLRLAPLGACVVLLGGFLVWFIPALFGYTEVTPVLTLELPGVGPLTIRYYTLAALLAVLMALFAFKVLQRSTKELDQVDEWEAILFALIPGIFAARFYYVGSLPVAQINPVTFFQLDAGGLSIVGGMLGGLFGLWLYSKLRKVNLLPLVSAIAVVLPLAHGIGRFGNFFNRELLGIPTGIPFGMFVPFLYRPFGYLQSEFFHPLFLYEALSNFALFAALAGAWYIFQKRGKLTEAFSSLFFIKMYLAWYYTVRFVLDFIRVDNSVRPYGLTYTQWLYLAVMGLILLYSAWFQIQFRLERGVWFTEHKQLQEVKRRGKS